MYVCTTDAILSFIVFMIFVIEQFFVTGLLLLGILRVSVIYTCIVYLIDSLLENTELITFFIMLYRNDLHSCYRG